MPPTTRLRCSWVLAACALGSLGAACHATRHDLAAIERPTALQPLADLAARAAAEPDDAPVRPATFVLDTAWREMSLERFERWVQDALPGVEPVEVAKPDRAELKRALAAMDGSSVRAAVILARTRDPLCYEILLSRLEDRIEGPERASDAGDVIAAAALGRLRNVRELGKRLEDLVVGANVHPDLEVRVECAAALLEYKRTRGIGFLLRVLREATPAADPTKRDWNPTPHMAWPKSRAATALAKFLGVPNEFRPDGSVAHQMEVAAQLEELWREKKRQLEPPKN
ncbi:MAG: hypothetical protein L6Q99_00300 [Planctomycetes bacterium]|nr:hypothetical protein [Planctomycetota bacterium]